MARDNRRALRKRSEYSWPGQLEGATSGVAYVSKETPMLSYMNTHAILEERRKRAKLGENDPPRVIVSVRASVRPCVCVCVWRGMGEGGRDAGCFDSDGK